MAGCDLCGFNIRGFDIKLLCAEFKRVRSEFPLAGRRVIDVFDIYRLREKRDLSSAVLFYTGKSHEGAHGAEADAMAVVTILDAQAEMYGLPDSVSGIAENESGAFYDIAGNFTKNKIDGSPSFTFGKYKGLRVQDVIKSNRGYLTWFLDQDFLDDAKQIVRDVLYPPKAKDATTQAIPATPTDDVF